MKNQIYNRNFFLIQKGLEKSFLYLFFLVLFWREAEREAFAQDMHFTQFYATSQYLNPAFTGGNGCSRFSATYRDQWPGISKTYKSFLCSADHNIQEKDVSLGILFGSDIAGTGELKTTIINPTVAYEVRMSKKLAIRFGI